MTFLRNSWYVAAWDDEIGDGIDFHRRILGEDILFARDKGGDVQAVRNRCPHRFAPLDRGRKVDGQIECPYHGLRFDLLGQCNYNPHGDGKIPPNARIQTYPVALKHMLIWIWMGDTEVADPATIPDLCGLDPEKFAINKGYMYTPVNYEYLTDNVMDLGHIEFLHEGLLGSEAVRRARTETKQEGSTVYSYRLTNAEVLPLPLDYLFSTHGKPIDRWLDVRWDPPGLMQLVIGAAPQGEGDARRGLETPGVHLMTPETENTTHYFWSNSRDFRRDDTVLHEQLEMGLRQAFEQQDKPMLIAQREAIGEQDFWDLNPVILDGDRAAVRARRILRKLIRDENTAKAVAT